MAAFTLGALIPLLAIVGTPLAIRLPFTVSAVLIALAGTGITSARLSGGSPVRPMVRNVVVGTLTMGLTYLAGTFVGSLL